MKKKSKITAAIVAATCLVMSSFITAQAADFPVKQDVFVQDVTPVQTLRKELTSELSALERGELDVNLTEAVKAEGLARASRDAESGGTRDGSLPYEYPTYDYVTGYLTETGAQHIYDFGTLPAGVYIQMQLTQPADASIDYDLYLLKSDYTIVAASECYTYLGTNTETLQETIGYVTNATTGYYVLVNSSAGGSSTSPYKLEYSLINYENTDSYEPTELPNVGRTLTITNGQASASDATLSSAIDSDWYVLDLTNAGGTGTTQLTVTSASTNTPKMEIYTSVLNINQAIAMNKVAQGTTVSVPNQLYYIRVINANAPAVFSVGAIGTYTLSANVQQQEPQIQVSEVTVATMYYNNDIYAAEVDYGAYKGWRIGAPTAQPNVVVYGSAYQTNANGQKIAAPGVQVQVIFRNLDVNNTVTVYVTTDERGAYEARFTVPQGSGLNEFISSYYKHKYDRCRVESSVGNVRATHNVIHFVKQIPR